MNVKPLGDRIVVRREAAQEKTAGGILLPDNARQKPQKGTVVRPKKIGILRQDQSAFDNYRVIDTVIMGNMPLWTALEERETLYSKADLTDEDGMRLGELEGVVAEEEGNFPLARSIYEECLPVWRELGFQRLLAWSLHGLGYVAYRYAYPGAFTDASRHTMLAFGGTNTAVLLISAAV